VRTYALKNNRHNTHNDTDTTKRQVLVADYFEEVAGATYELIEECCYAVTAISRASVTSCRLVVRAFTLMLAITCLTVTVGVWAWTVGKGLWSEIFP
jgi:hypothetical protein